MYNDISLTKMRNTFWKKACHPSYWNQLVKPISNARDRILFLRFYCTIPTAFVRQSDFKNPGIFCFWNCWDQKLLAKLFHGMRNPGLWNPEVNSRNPESRWWLNPTDKESQSGIQYLKSGMQRVEFRIHDFFGLPCIGLTTFIW